MLRKTFLALALVLGISSNTQAQAPTPSLIEPPPVLTLPKVDKVAHWPPAAPAIQTATEAISTEAKPVVHPVDDPMKTLLRSMRKIDEKRAAAEEERNNVWKEKVEIEAALAGLETRKTNLTRRLQQETTRANNAEQRLEEKDKQTVAAIGQYQNFSGAIKNLIVIAIVGFLLLVIGLVAVFSRIVDESRARSKIQKEIMARMPTDTNDELQKRNTSLAGQLAEQGDELAAAKEMILALKGTATELESQHAGQMERLGRQKGAAEALVQAKLVQITELERHNNALTTELGTARESVPGLTELLVLSLDAFRGAAKDFTDLSCPHSLDSIIAAIAARVEPPTPAPAPEDDPYQPPEGIKKRLIIIDDDPAAE